MRSSHAFPDHGINDTDIEAAPGPGCPNTEALLAGTLALMTGVAQQPCARQRALLAQKVIANLGTLSAHPMASPGFRATAASLCDLWLRLLAQGEAPRMAGPAEGSDGSARPFVFESQFALWHGTPARVQ